MSNALQTTKFITEVYFESGFRDVRYHNRAFEKSKESVLRSIELNFSKSRRNSTYYLKKINTYI